MDFYVDRGAEIATQAGSGSLESLLGFVALIGASPYMRRHCAEQRGGKHTKIQARPLQVQAGE